jgi:hypothetical protein
MADAGEVDIDISEHILGEVLRVSFGLVLFFGLLEVGPRLVSAATSNGRQRGIASENAWSASA